MIEYTLLAMFVSFLSGYAVAVWLKKRRTSMKAMHLAALHFHPGPPSFEYVGRLAGRGYHQFEFGGVDVMTAYGNTWFLMVTGERAPLESERALSARFKKWQIDGNALELV